MARRYRKIRRVPARKTNYLANANSAISLASNAVRGVSLLRSLINTEFDYVDTLALQNMPAAGSINLLNGMTQGDGPNNRTGTSIKMKSYEIKYGLQNNATAINTQCRVLLVLDKQSNGAAPVLTDILQTNSPYSPRNLNNRKRFKILMDKRYSLSTAGPNNTNDSTYMKNVETHVQFFSTSNLGTIADISSNALYLVHCSDQATNFPTINYYCRVRYLDN